MTILFGRNTRLYNGQANEVDTIFVRLVDQAAVTSTPTANPAVLADGFKHVRISRSATGIFTVTLNASAARILGVKGLIPTNTGNRTARVDSVTKNSVTVRFQNLAGADSNTNFNLVLAVFLSNPVY